jgi:glycosyltransferase involved in cell wall biosynthesis
VTRLLIFAQAPPPVHGQSVMVGQLLEALRNSGQLAVAEEAAGGGESSSPIVYLHLDPQVSEDLADIGRWRPRKLLLVLRAIFAAVRYRFRYGLTVFYFVPAPAKRTGMYRDWCVLLFCRIFYRRLVLHWHCIGQPEFIEGKLSAPERLLARLAYGYPALSICLSNYSREEAAYFHSERTVVIPNGLPDPCPKFDEEVWPERQCRAAARAASSDESFFYEVLFLSGRMTPKGLFDAIAAVTRANRLLAAKGGRWRMRLTVAGDFADDAERLRFEQAATELNQTASPDNPQPLALAVGWAGEEKKKQLYRAADCFLFPTTYPAESFGLVLAEAMAHGCVVVATRWQAVPEVLPAGYSHLVEPHAIEEMADALLACAAEPADRSLRDYFLSRFTSDRFADEMVRVLSEL